MLGNVTIGDGGMSIHHMSFDSFPNCGPTLTTPKVALIV